MNSSSVASVYGVRGQVPFAVWALASAWRRMTQCPLHGTVVITGRTSDGEAAALDDDLAEHARTVTQTVRQTLKAWKARPPASSEAAVSELLAYAARDVASGR
ncbi:amidohydrolase [Streptomyces sp. MUSC 14]|uniref:amidohydrolase n=1 Tax=Streptomyces sp. MUSC 14 TaxID=1354889 RepID=UPI001160BD58|nr:amidohydrolase [Streptomyces sp. MUSC 14]